MGYIRLKLLESITVPYLSSWFEKKEEGVYTENDASKVVEVGRFGEWAPKKLRGKRLYTALFNQEQRLDPPTAAGGRFLTYTFFENMCYPADSSKTWSGCVDAAYQSGCEWPSGTVASITLGRCDASALATGYAPTFFTFSGQPSSYNNPHTTSGVTTAYAKPCPYGSSAPDLSGALKMSDTLKIKGAVCPDTSTTPPQYYDIYSAQDASANAYTVAWVGLGAASSTSSYLYTLLQVASFSKGTSDVYYYMYRIAFPLGGSGAPWTA